MILQATVGCSHNKCAFCSMYKNKKFRVRELSEIFADIEEVAKQIKEVKRVFLADGNSLAIPTEQLLQILSRLYEAFPYLERVSVYANPQDILDKGVEQLGLLREAGLTLAYLGVETGNQELLEKVNKGATREEMVEAGRIAREGGITLSVTVINGLGGKELMGRHAQDTAVLLSQMDPDYLAFLSLMLAPGAPMTRWAEKGEFVPLEPMEILEEIRLMLQDLELSSCVFRSNHASNYLPLKGHLPQDQERLLQMLDEVLQKKDTRYLRPEQFRSL